MPTLVEVKRSSDGRIRREVVGQMLDYAASVTNWQADTLRGWFEAECAAPATGRTSVGWGPTRERSAGQALAPRSGDGIEPSKRRAATGWASGSPSLCRHTLEADRKVGGSAPSPALLASWLNSVDLRGRREGASEVDRRSARSSYAGYSVARVSPSLGRRRGR